MIRVELTRDEAKRILVALRLYSVPKETWDTQDKFVIALYEAAKAEKGER